MSKLGIVIVAAGKGSRMRSAVSKQYLLLQGKQVLIRTLEVFQFMQEVDEIVVVVGKEDISVCRDTVDQHKLTKVKSVVAGGEERQSSVYKGIQAFSNCIEWVMVHDGVRPFIKPSHIVRLWKEAKRTGAAVLAVPVKETIKSIDDNGKIESTPDRSKLWSIQTPQAFRLSSLMEAHAKAAAEGFLGTDDSMLVERMGLPVQAVKGDYTNIKITTSDDLLWAEYVLTRRDRK